MHNYNVVIMLKQTGEIGNARMAAQRFRPLLLGVLTGEMPLLSSTRKALEKVQTASYQSREETILGFKEALFAGAGAKHLYAAAMKNPSLNARGEGASPLLAAMLVAAFEVGEIKFTNVAKFAFSKQPSFKCELLAPLMRAQIDAGNQEKAIRALLWLQLETKELVSVLEQAKKSNDVSMAALLEKIKSEAEPISMRYSSGIG